MKNIEESLVAFVAAIASQDKYNKDNMSVADIFEEAKNLLDAYEDSINPTESYEEILNYLRLTK